MPDDAPLPNYRMIAETCGVGKTTVGRVLQGNGYVSAAVRKMVLEASAQLGYRPDPALGALSRRRWPKGARPQTATFAWIFRGRKGASFPEAPEFFGARARARELGYSVDVFNLGDYPSAPAISRVIYNRGIRGVLVQAMRDGENLDLDWPLFFTVYVGPENDIARVHNVQADFRSAMHCGVRACVERGYRRIGIALMNYLASGTNVPFRAQALYERERLEAEFGPQPSLFTSEPEENNPAAISRWARSHKVDAIVANHIEPYYLLTSDTESNRRRTPWKVPGDVGFICLRDAAGLPHLTHMSLREAEQGRQAVDLAHQQLQHGVVGQPTIPLRVLVPPAFIDGASLPERKAGPGKKRQRTTNGH